MDKALGRTTRRVVDEMATVIAEIEHALEGAEERAKRELALTALDDELEYLVTCLDPLDRVARLRRVHAEYEALRVEAAQR